jgi:hypothetical protein
MQARGRPGAMIRVVATTVVLPTLMTPAACIA